MKKTHATVIGITTEFGVAFWTIKLILSNDSRKDRKRAIAALKKDANTPEQVIIMVNGDKSPMTTDNFDVDTDTGKPC